MKHLWLIASAILMTACETVPPPMEFTFEEFKTIEAEVTYPEELPKLRELECYPGEADECKIAGYTSTRDIDVFETYKIRAKSNTTIAQGNAEALEAVLEQADELVAAGKAQEQITRIREEQLYTERALRVREKWYYRAMLVLVGAAGVFAAR